MLGGNSFDGYGHYCFGLSKQRILPELPFDSINQVQELNITISTNCKKDAEGSVDEVPEEGR